MDDHGSVAQEVTASIRLTAGLVVAAFLSVATIGCGSLNTRDRPDPSPSGSSVSVAPPLPVPPPFVVEGYEPAAEVKETAVEFLETGLNVLPEDVGVLSARERIPQELASDKAVAQLKPLFGNMPMSTQVVYPQLGGLTRKKASIIAVIDTQHPKNETIVGTKRVLDLRLTLSGDAWKVTSVESTGGDLSATGATQSAQSSAVAGTSELVAELLADDNINIADTTAQDLLTGDIDERPLTVIRDFAREHRLGVAVLRTGHPREVFATDRRSNHSRGKAIDIWEIDGKPVSYYAEQPADDNPARALMEAALTAGSDEVGGPWAFSTQEGATFTNTVHQDHIHIGYKH